MKGKLQLEKQRRNQTLRSVILSCEVTSGFNQWARIFFWQSRSPPCAWETEGETAETRHCWGWGNTAVSWGSPLPHSSPLGGMPYPAFSRISPSTCHVAGPWSAECCPLSAFACMPGPGGKLNPLFIVNPTQPADLAYTVFSLWTLF